MGSAGSGVAGGAGAASLLGGAGMGGSSSGGASAGSAGGGAAGAPDAHAGGGGLGSPHPLLGLLPLFTASNVPDRGPMEANPNPRNYNGAVPTRPGNGLAQHPMLYVGENYNRILLTNEGKVIWTYDTQGGFELDDVWMLSNGNILYSHMRYIEEITPTKQVVWHYVPPGNAEIHTCQPIGLDKVLLGLNAIPMPKLQLLNTKTQTIEWEHDLAEGLNTGTNPHGEMRRMRMTAAGTYLVAFLVKKKVVEYGPDFKILRTITTPQPWSVAPLHNGNTLIMDENESTCKEFDPQGNLAWSLKKSEIMVPGAQLNGGTQSCERLASGNTVVFIHSSPGNLQAVEVTKDKNVVWALEDWQHLGDATAAQFLDEPGIPEVPGSTEH